MTNKTERINIRLTPEEKELIENAAALDGVSVAAFVRQSVLHRVRWRGLDNAKRAASMRKTPWVIGDKRDVIPTHKAQAGPYRYDDDWNSPEPDGGDECDHDYIVASRPGAPFQLYRCTKCGDLI